VGNIRSQERRLTETIDKLLALAEVEQHGWLQKRAPVDAGALLRQAVEATAVQAAARAVTLRIDAEEPLPGLDGDAFLLRQALCNLLDNAIAFSPAGGEVVLAARREAGGLRLSVEDAGPGVPDYARERVFERFYSLPRPDGTPRSSGLGLPFVREVARLHGGEARLDDRAGGGARAVLFLPVARTA
ncbi:MAG: ATP-binding protein, partial [Gammaproteobacteria bacterium]